MSSCDGYHDSHRSVSAVQDLNNQVNAARLTNDKWTNSPENIAHHLFPSISHDSGPKRYEVTKKSNSNDRCLVTVLEEGPIDDEILGERHTNEFQLTGGKWNIVSYQYAVKRRD